MAQIGMKVYDLQWFTTYGMDYQEAAQALRDDGVDTVFTQNRIDPLPSSGVDQHAYLARYGERLAAYDDAQWMAALREAGIWVMQTTATFFDPDALEQFPDARPINALGEPDRGFGWYTGVCPTSDDYLQWKIERLRRVNTELKPNGIFLQFTRFPGFWENWTWNPDYAFTDADQWCFCDRCRALFQLETGVRIPSGDVRQQAQWILSDHREEWERWRCAVLDRVIERIIEGAKADLRGAEVILNTLPFPAADFGGLDVRRTIAGQDLDLLQATVDGFELMTYLQILNRPVSWLREAIADLKRQVWDVAVIFCTLQVSPLYTDGIHAGRNRSPVITADDLREAGIAALEAGTEALVFYHWTDFLDDEAAGGSKWQVLRELAARKGGPA
jgi:hypothetical protein